MSVDQITRFKGSDTEGVVALARRAKPIWLKHGASAFRLSRVHSGPFAGQWLVVVSYPDWSTFGEAHEAASRDLEFAKVMAETLSKFTLEDRTVVVEHVV
jgi:hypothetical protein